MKGLEIIVHGKVQGVWFRKYTQEKATELQLSGFVMNQPNGTVFIEAYGNALKLEELINWLETKGSPLSKVEKIETKITTSTNTFSSFKINR